jgi:hypothetical protein
VPIQGGRRVTYWLRAVLVAVMAGFVTGLVVNVVATLAADPTCSRGLCDSDQFGQYKLVTIWLPMAIVTTAVLAGAWVIRHRG